MLGEKGLEIACLFFFKPVNSYSSFKTPFKFHLPWEVFLISKGCYPVLPLGIHTSLYTAPSPRPPSYHPETGGQGKPQYGGDF